MVVGKPHILLPIRLGKIKSGNNTARALWRLPGTRSFAMAFRSVAVIKFHAALKLGQMFAARVPAAATVAQAVAHLAWYSEINLTRSTFELYCVPKSQVRTSGDGLQGLVHALPPVLDDPLSKTDSSAFAALAAQPGVVFVFVLKRAVPPAHSWPASWFPLDNDGTGVAPTQAAPPRRHGVFREAKGILEGSGLPHGEAEEEDW